MRFLKIISAYPQYINDFYTKNKSLSARSFKEQQMHWNNDLSPWSFFWEDALKSLGFETFNIIKNNFSMQGAWERENLLTRHGKRNSNDDIIIEQVKKFKPEVLWFCDYDRSLLRRIRESVPSIKIVLGWTGSAIPKSDVWNDIDLILSCAPETKHNHRL